MLPTIATGNVGSALAGEYEVANSLRFNDPSSDNLSRTPSGATNRKTWTFSIWIKRSNLGVGNQIIFSQGADNNNSTQLRIESGNGISMWTLESGVSYDHYQLSDRLFRDVSAWYHLVLAFDTTQSTASDRVKFYVNGVEETDFSSVTNPSLNFDTDVNTANPMRLGAKPAGGDYFDGYMAEAVLIDGQQLDATSFGEFDSDTNIWKPIDVSGLTFGTNGFYLDFENSGSLGADVSGNGNNFTVNNLTSIDQTTDTCTNNFATWNPLSKNSNINLENGNTSIRPQANSIDTQALSTLAFESGKWYFEFKYLENDDYQLYGISTTEGAVEDVRNDDYPGQRSSSVAQYGRDGQIYENNSATAFGTSYTSNDIIMMAVDSDNSKIYFGLNGTWQNSSNPATGTNGYSYNSANLSGLKCVVAGNGTIGYDNTDANFGNPAFSISSGNSDGNGYGNFEYSVPSGYYALCTKNLAEYG